MKNHKYSKSVLTLLALAFGSFGSASLQASPENPLIGSTIPLTTFEPALGREVDYDQRHGAGDFNALHNWLKKYPKEIMDQYFLQHHISKEEFEAYGERQVRSRWPQMSRTGKILLFEHCPSDMQLEFFQSLTPQEQVVALQGVGPMGLLQGPSSKCWEYASDEVREAALVHMAKKPSLSFILYGSELMKTTKSMKEVGEFLSLVNKGVKNFTEFNILVGAYNELNLKDKAKNFAAFVEICEKFGNVSAIIDNYKDLCKEGYGTYVDKDGNEESLFSVLSDDVKKELFKPFFKKYKDNQESAKEAFIAAYKLDEDEEDLDFIDDLYDEDELDD